MDSMQTTKCGVFEVAAIVGKKWTIPLLQEIQLNGDKGFNHILKRMDKITPKILAKRLKDLESEGLVEKQTNGMKKRATAYAITQKGFELIYVIDKLKQWNTKYSEQDVDCAKQECVKCELY